MSDMRCVDRAVQMNCASLEWDRSIVQYDQQILLLCVNSPVHLRYLSSASIPSSLIPGELDQRKKRDPPGFFQFHLLSSNDDMRSQAAVQPLCIRSNSLSHHCNI